MAQGRDVGEHTRVLPYASIETVEKGGTPALDPTRPLLLEAKLVWGRDILAVRHVPARGAIRVRDLSLAVPGCKDLVIGDVDPATGAFALRLPNGNAVPAGCRLTVRLGRSLLRLSLVPDDVAKLPRARHDSLVAFGLIAAAALHLVVLATVAHSRVDEGETEQAARATMLRMVASAEERALSELAAVQQKTRDTRAEELAAAAAVASTADHEEARAGNPSKRDGAAARARITRGDDRHAVAPTTTSPSRTRQAEREEAATFGILSVLAGGDSGPRPGSAAFAPETGRSAMGNIFGQTIDDAAGIGGLGLSGAGEGGGGKGAGIPLGSIGVPIANIQCKLIDVETGEEITTTVGMSAPGELLVRGPNVMLGYLGRDEATRDTLDADGFLHTGDIASVDENGVFWIVDRLKELIKYKGYQVAPAELEALLLTHPEIVDAAVVAALDEEAGEIPKAFIVLKDGSELDAQSVIDFVASHVAPHKKVRAVAFIDAVPKSSAGKILRKDLKGK